MRKTYPIGTGVLDYFPDALAAVAFASYMATQQHHPGQPMHWDRNKSTDHADCLMRHFIERGTIDSDGVRHSAKMAWRALALLQTEIENDASRSAASFDRNSDSIVDVKAGPTEPPLNSGLSQKSHGMVCQESLAGPNEKGT